MLHRIPPLPCDDRTLSWARHLGVLLLLGDRWHNWDRTFHGIRVLDQCCESDHNLIDRCQGRFLEVHRSPELPNYQRLERNETGFGGEKFNQAFNKGCWSPGRLMPRKKAVQVHLNREDLSYHRRSHVFDSNLAHGYRSGLLSFSEWSVSADLHSHLSRVSRLGPERYRVTALRFFESLESRLLSLFRTQITKIVDNQNRTITISLLDERHPSISRLYLAREDHSERKSP